VEKTLQISIARLSQQSGVPLSTVTKSLKIGYNCIQINVVQELQPADY
jgi:hypothetical protein